MRNKLWKLKTDVENLSRSNKFQISSSKALGEIVERLFISTNPKYKKWKENQELVLSFWKLFFHERNDHNMMDFLVLAS